MAARTRASSFLRRLLLASAAAGLAAAFAACCPGPARPVRAAAAPAPPAPAPTSKEDIAPEAATGHRDVQATAGGRFMVAAANPHAAEAGRAMLREGGSAVDAAVAMAVMLTLVEPQSSGIGGGAFMLHYDPQDKQVRAYDGRETAPAKADGDMFLNAQGKPLSFFKAVVGGLSVGVPGELRMLEMAHKQHGKLPWKRLFEPTVALAEKGFPLSARLHALLARDPFLPKMDVAGPYFYGPDGKPKAVGSILKNPALAATLRTIAEQGAGAFYTGPIANDIATTAAGATRNPGRLRAPDLAGYKAVARAAVCRPYRHYQVCGMPPPTSGGVTTLQILGMLERFDLSAHPAGSVQSVHLVSEASRLAFADRALYLADADFVKVPVDALLNPAYLQKRAALIQLDKSMGSAAPGDNQQLQAARFAPDHSHEVPATSHFVAIDKSGRVVSMTASIESAFGSHLMVRGFLLNNELTDFSFKAKDGGKPVANRVQPGKRPRSSMAPMIVLNKADGSFHLAVGSPGGSRIIGYVARVLVDVLDHRLPLQDAVNRPHFLNRNGPTELERMPGQRPWLQATREALEAMGHQVKVGDMNSGLHAVMRSPGGAGKSSLQGAADPRREGVVLAD